MKRASEFLVKPGLRPLNVPRPSGSGESKKKTEELNMSAGQKATRPGRKLVLAGTSSAAKEDAAFVKSFFIKSDSKKKQNASHLLYFTSTASTGLMTTQKGQDLLNKTSQNTSSKLE